MKKGIGQAMKRNMGFFPFNPSVVPEEEISLLHNRKRLKILEYLSNFPCASVSAISRETGISPTTVRWHLRTMEESGLVDENNGVFYPSGFVPKEMCALFLALHSENSGRIIDILIKRGPLRPIEISRGLKISPQSAAYHLKKLERYGLILREKREYEISFDVMEVQKRYAEIMRDFVANLLLKAKFQGVIMDMKEKDGCFVISVSAPERSEIRVHEIPFFEVLG